MKTDRFAQTRARKQRVRAHNLAWLEGRVAARAPFSLTPRVAKRMDTIFPGINEATAYFLPRGYRFSFVDQKSGEETVIAP